MKEQIKYDVGQKVRFREPAIYGLKEHNCVISMITISKNGIKYRGKDCDIFDTQYNFPQEWIMEG